MQSLAKITGLVACLLISLSVHAASEPKSLFYLKQNIEEDYPEVNHIDVATLRQMMLKDAGKIILLDVREIKEFNVSHLRDSLATPSLSVAIKHLEGKDKNHLIVAYCSVGYRSAKMVDALAERGYTNAYNFVGSIFEWANSGYLVYKDEQPVQRVHPFGLWWGRYLRRDLWGWK